VSSLLGVTFRFGAPLVGLAAPPLITAYYTLYPHKLFARAEVR
jgi:hypothetical protein